MPCYCIAQHLELRLNESVSAFLILDGMFGKGSQNHSIKAISTGLNPPRSTSKTESVPFQTVQVPIFAATPGVNVLNTTSTNYIKGS